MCLELKKHKFSVYCQQKFVIRYTPSISIYTVAVFLSSKQFTLHITRSNLTKKKFGELYNMYADQKPLLRT